MTYLAIRLPTGLSYGFSSGPNFLTHVDVAAESGKEFRNIIRDFPLVEIDCSTAVRTTNEIAEFQKFIRIVHGKAYTWRCKDWTDFECTSGVVVELTTSPSQRSFQLYKRYAYGGYAVDRIILKPVESSVVVKLSGGAFTDYDLDAETGIINTDASQVAANLTWTGEFDILCRFDSDGFKARLIDLNCYQIDQLSIREVLDE